MKTVPNSCELHHDLDHVLCFLGIISNVSPWSLQMISWSPLLMEEGNTVFSKATSCCSAVPDPTRPTEESAPAETILRGRLRFVKTAYSSGRAAGELRTNCK